MNKVNLIEELGINNPSNIERFSVRREGDKDILKIYFCKDKKTLFAKSVKFKYPCQRKIYGIGEQEFVMNNKLQAVVEELNDICGSKLNTAADKDLKKKILSDLRHLEKVVHSKISEIEQDLAKLTNKND